MTVLRTKKTDYISIICSFKESFFGEIAQTDSIRDQTTDYIYSLFPKELISGRLQYVYQYGHNMDTWEEQIGTSILNEDK